MPADRRRGMGGSAAKQPSPSFAARRVSSRSLRSRRTDRTTMTTPPATSSTSAFPQFLSNIDSVETMPSNQLDASLPALKWSSPATAGTCAPSPFDFAPPATNSVGELGEVRPNLLSCPPAFTEGFRYKGSVFSRKGKVSGGQSVEDHSAGRDTNKGKGSKNVPLQASEMEAGLMLTPTNSVQEPCEVGPNLLSCPPAFAEGLRYKGLVFSRKKKASGGASAEDCSGDRDTNKGEDDQNEVGKIGADALSSLYLREAIDGMPREYGPSLKRAICLLTAEEVAELDSKFKKLRSLELKQYAQRINLTRIAVNRLRGALDQEQ